MENQDLVYRVDRQDVVVYVNPAWDPFAGSNGGEDIVSERVVDRSLWDFVVDATTRQLYRQLLQRVREGRHLRFTYRCDSPGCRRLMEMEMSPAAASAVQFRSRTVSTTDREPQALWERRDTHSDDLLVACGWCKKVQVEGDWTEVEDAVRELRLFERHRSPSLSHGICEECHRAILRTLTVSNDVETLERH